MCVEIFVTQIRFYANILVFVSMSFHPEPNNMMQNSLIVLQNGKIWAQNVTHLSNNPNPDLSRPVQDIDSFLNKSNVFFLPRHYVLAGLTEPMGHNLCTLPHLTNLWGSIVSAWLPWSRTSQSEATIPAVWLLTNKKSATIQREEKQQFISPREDASITQLRWGGSTLLSNIYSRCNSCW